MDKELAGIRRIFIELEGEPEKAKQYSEKYAELVKSAVNFMKNEAKIKPGQEGPFVAEIKGVLKNLGVQPGETRRNFISESLDKKKWDCKNSAFLVYDVAKGLEIDASFVSTPDHMLIVTKSFLLETTDGTFTFKDALKDRHPVVCETGADDMADSFSHMNRGRAYARQGDYGKALESYNRSIATDPRNFLAYYNRGNAQMMLEKYYEAIADFGMAIALSPSYVPAYNNRGTAFLGISQFKEAVDEFTKALSIDPSHAAAFYNRGNAYVSLEKYEEAIADYTKAIALNPEYEAAYNNRGIAYGKLGK